MNSVITILFFVGGDYYTNNLYFYFNMYSYIPNYIYIYRTYVSKT